MIRLTLVLALMLSICKCPRMLDANSNWLVSFYYQSTVGAITIEPGRFYPTVLTLTNDNPTPLQASEKIKINDGTPVITAADKYTIDTASSLTYTIHIGVTCATPAGVFVATWNLQKKTLLTMGPLQVTVTQILTQVQIQVPNLLDLPAGSWEAAVFTLPMMNVDPLQFNFTGDSANEPTAKLKNVILDSFNGNLPHQLETKASIDKYNASQVHQIFSAPNPNSCFALSGQVTFNASPKENSSEVCYYNILNLAGMDKCLSSRLDLKSNAAKTANSVVEYMELIQGVPCSGTYFACGLTSSWVSEIFEGADSQYETYKYDDFIDGSNAGYGVYIGNDLINLFESNLKNNHIIYHMRHTGTHDHVWLVEQLPNSLGFRVYQSYAGAYSLKAWLSSSLTGLFNGDDGDIIIWRNIQAQVDQSIRLISQGQASLQFPENIPAEYTPLLPYIYYVRDMDENLTTSNLEAAWSNFGSGKVIPWEQFRDNYLTKLANLTQTLKDNDKTWNLYTQQTMDDWISLAGAPDPMYFPNLPYNAIAPSIVGGNMFYRFEVKTVIVEKHPDCEGNVDFMLNILD